MVRGRGQSAEISAGGAAEAGRAGPLGRKQRDTRGAWMSTDAEYVWGQSSQRMPRGPGSAGASRAQNA
eukprot:14401057-Alexandrium_andersonii.AAC.1